MQQIAHPARHKAGHWLGLQLLLTGIAAGVAAWLGSVRVAEAMVWGSVIAGFPSFVFARIALSYCGGREPRLVIRNFMWAELLKWLLTAVFFVMAIKLAAPVMWVLFVTFILGLVWWICFPLAWGRLLAKAANK